MFRDIANGCKEVHIINSSQYNELFDGMNHQSLSERVGLFIQKITNTIEFCPDHIRTFLSILREQDHVVLSTLAHRIAASCKLSVITIIYLIPYISRYMNKIMNTGAVTLLT